MVQSQHFGFGLTSDQCELLLAFEETGSLTRLAEAKGRDISVVSRQLQKVSEAAAVLEKLQGKWRLTKLGCDVNHWTRGAVAAQKRLLRQRSVIRIASTREFTARILSPRLKELAPPGGDNTEFSISASECGIERLLLAGEADFGFDCGTPNDPAIRFKTVKCESFVAVASPAFLKHHKIKGQADLISLPHLQYKRASAPGLLHLSHEMPNVVASFNDIASIREACMAGLGWAVLPRYTVDRELQIGALKPLPFVKLKSEPFGVWWLRGRNSLEPWITKAVQWLKEQNL